jgi:hypothetical protein
MRRIAVLCCTASLIACSSEGKKADSVAVTPQASAPAAAPALTLASLAGKWNMVGKNEAGDSTVATFVMTATADTAGWTIAFPNRPVMPARASVSGDSVMIDFGPYESVIRKGVTVTTHNVMRLQGDRLVGKTHARYSVKTADSLRTLNSEGTRVP